MTNKDVFKILLCSYGYDRNIKIESYYGDDGDIGYDIYAENKEGDSYEQVDCEGFMFHIYEILNFMKDNKADFKSNWWSIPTKHLLDDNLRNSTIEEWDKRDKEIQDAIIKIKPLNEWRKINNPCPTCNINKKDHWDNIHYNCELNHNHTCTILSDFESNYQVFREEFDNI